MMQSIRNIASEYSSGTYGGEAARGQPSDRSTPLDHPAPGPGSLFNIPAHSTLGRWLKQLDNALRTPDFKQWMRANDISPSNVQFHPDTQALDVIINGQPQTFTLDDHSGFAAVAGPLIQAVQALGFWPPASGTLLNYPFKPYNVASVEEVSQFYGVSQSDAQAVSEMLRSQTFPTLPGTDPRRGDAALAAQQRIVGDMHDRHQLMEGLARVLIGLPPPPAAIQAIARDLSSNSINVSAGSSYSQAYHHGEPARATLAQLLQTSGKQLPKTTNELKRLLRELTALGPPNPNVVHDKARYEALILGTYAALPNVRDEAKKWAEAIILNLTGFTVDANTVFLNRFGNAQSTTSATGWEHRGEEPIRSQALPDALLSNFNEQDALPGVLDQDAGLYKVGAGYSQKGGYGAHNQFPLAPSALMHESWKTNFQLHITDKLERFWQDHGADYRTALKGEFVAQARAQLKHHELASADERQQLPAEQRFTADDYRLVMGAASNLPLDKHKPLTVKQLQATAPVKGAVITHVFDLNGFQSTDILRFSGNGGVQVLYIPGHQPAFLRFESLEKMDQWVADQGKDADKSQALASHFSLRDRQDNDSGFWTDVKMFFTADDTPNKGVDTALKYLGNGYWDNIEGTIIDSANVRILGDVFSAMRDATQQRMTSDADVMIKSDSEVTRDTWLNDLTAAAGLAAKFAVIAEPIVIGAALASAIAETVVGLEKTKSGDTQAERQQGASTLLDGMLNTLFSVLGGVGGTEDEALERPSTLSLRDELFADGQRAQVIDHPLSESAYTLPRAKGYDLVDGDGVYRYLNDKPGELSDLESLKGNEPLDTFEAVCSASSIGHRVRRAVSEDCFAKIIANLPKPEQQLQAMEHVRLFPSKAGVFSKSRQVIYEKRVYTMAETQAGSQLIPVANAKRIIYKNRVSGKIIADPGFGFYSGAASGKLAQQTRVVRLNKISNSVDDQRQLRAVVVNRGAEHYLVVEADTAEFYYAPMGKARTGDITFKKCSPFELDLVQDYRKFLSRNHSMQALDADLVALPKLKGAYELLRASGYTEADIDALKKLCKPLTDEQQREVVYQLQRARAITPPDVALRPQRVTALEKPSDFSSWPARQQNQFYAENAKHNVKLALKATGLGPGNMVRSAGDLARGDAASMTLGWLRRTADLRAPNAANLVMKSGAGNCGEMALLSRDIVRRSGGLAHEWGAGTQHSFTVIGGPSGLAETSIDFSGPAWADAWIVDPWADIACPASDYIRQLKATMSKWEAAGWKIREGNQADMSPLDPDWMDTLIKEPKRRYLSDTETTPAERVVPRLPRRPAEATVHVAMGESTTLAKSNEALSTRNLSDCSALAVLTDWNGSTYQTRTLMHLTGSNLELGLRGNTQELLETLRTSLEKGGRVIWVGGVNSQSIQGMATVIGQEFQGQQPLRNLLKERPGVTVTIAGSAGVTVKADGSFELIPETGKGVFSTETIRQIFDRID